MKTLLLFLLVVFLSPDFGRCGDATLTFYQKGSWTYSSPTGGNARLAYPDAEPLEIKVAIRPAEEAGAALRDSASAIAGALLPSPFYPRPGASADDIEQARELARSTFTSTAEELFNKNYFREIDGAKLLSLKRLLLVVGETEDVKEIVDFCDRISGVYKHPNIDYDTLLPIAAYIESRNGSLDDGLVNGLLGPSDGTLRRTAAMVLKTFGSNVADEVLIEEASKELSGLQLKNLFALLGDNTAPALLDAARARLSDGVQEWEKKQPKIEEGVPDYYDYVFTPVGLVSYLLVHGTDEDRANLAGYPLSPRVIRELFPVVEQPGILLEAYSNAEGYSTIISYFSESAHCLLGLPADTRRQTIHRMETLIFREGLELHHLKDMAPDRKVLGSKISLQTLFTPTVSSLVPPADISFFENASQAALAKNPVGWAIPSEKDIPNLVFQFLNDRPFKIGNGWAQGTRESALRKLDFFPHETVVQAVESGGASSEVTELLLAGHKISHGSFRDYRDRYRGPVQRYPYWLDSPGNGSIAGFLTFAPSLKNGILSFELTTDHTVLIERTMIDVEPDTAFPIHKYRENDGLTLIKGCHLLTNGKKVPIELSDSRDDGVLSGSTPLRSAAETYFVVEIDFLDASYEIACGLFNLIQE